MVLRKGFSIIWATFAVLLTMVYSTFGFENVILRQTFSILVLVTCLVGLFQFRKSKPMLIMNFMIFYQVYSVVMERYLFPVPSDPISVRYAQSVTESTMGYAIAILFIWLVVFYSTLIFLNKSNNYHVRVELISEKPTPIVGWIVIFSTLLILVTQFNFASLGSGTRGGTTPAVEYSSILFIFGYYYSGNDKLIRRLLHLVLLLYTVLLLAVGERVGVIQLIFVPLITCYSEKLSTFKILALLTSGVILMTIVSAYRQAFDLSGSVIGKTMESLLQHKFSNDGADYAYYTSMTMLLRANVEPFLYRIAHLPRYILGCFIGTDSWLQYHTFQYYFHNNGGFPPFIMYYYAGWIGNVVSAFTISAVVAETANRAKKLYRNKDSLATVLFILICVNTPRWLIYDYIIGFRSLFLMIVMYFAFKIILRKNSEFK